MASFRRSRRPLLSSCALASAMVALGQAPAAAQSFQGNVIGAPINATVDNSLPGQTTVTVTAPAAIVNWQPTDTAAGSAPINFQDAGTTATFRSNGIDYTVLNRILPSGAASSRSVLLNGTINSFIDSAAAGPQRGGAVWFYSPNGLVIGSQASIDVGSLLLTTRDLADTDFLTSNGLYNFGAADNSRSSVTIQAGAQINAGSYVAIVAPRIAQAGDVRVDGSAAYVAAEQATLTISGGLFDIQVQSGSAVDAGTPGDEVTLNHSGSTTGPAVASSGNPHAIYMVAIPKNVAIAMLVGGTVGYDIDAVVENNGTVVLSAGSGVDANGFLTGGPASGVGANLTIAGGGIFTSATRASARTDALARTGAGGSLTFDKGLALTGGRSATLNIGDNGAVDIGRDLNVTTTNQDDAGAARRGTAAITLGANARLTATGGDTFVNANAAALGDVTGGVARVTASAGAALTLQSLAISAEADSSQGNAVGGDAILSLTGASLDTQALSLAAIGRGGDGLDGGTGTGGTARLTLADASLFSENQIDVDARGEGGAGGNGGAAGLGVGGLAQFTVTGAASSVETDGGIQLIASGSGGFDISDGTGDGIGGGDGRGGTATFDFAGGQLRASGLTVDASGTGTDGVSSNLADLDGGAGGTGAGGAATASITAPSIDIGSVRVNASGVGGIGGAGNEIFDEFGYGTGTSPNGGAGGAALGGAARLTLADNLDAEDIMVDARATAGSSGGSAFGAQGNGGNAFGGIAALDLLANAGVTSASLTLTSAGLASNGGAIGGNGSGGGVTLNIADGASLALENSLAITADGTGGSGIARGGSGAGGNLNVTLGAGSSISLDSFSDLRLTARGTGGNALGSLVGDVGGDATGGTIALISAGGTISAFSLALDASAGGGSTSGTGGSAIGGDIVLDLTGGAIDVLSFVDLNAGADGGSGLAGGAATGGGIAVDFAGGASLGASEFFAAANALGGDGANSGNGGAATGGVVDFTIADASAGTLIEVGYGLSFEASGNGGRSADDLSGSPVGGYGGDGTGGRIGVRIGSGTITTDFPISLTARGSGGGVSGTSHDGGIGRGGDVTLDVGNAVVTAGTIALDAGGFGGDAGEFGYGAGGNGGAAFAGAARLLLAGGTIDALSLTIDASAQGGDGGDGGTHPLLGDLPGGKGGDALSGLALLDIDGGTATIGESADIRADAIAGDGGFSNIDTAPGAGGAATGGAGPAGGAIVDLRAGATLSAPNLSVSADAFGGRGGYSFATAPGVPTGADGGDATGGRAGVAITGAALSASQATISARGRGGNADVGSTDEIPLPVSGFSTGGLAELTAANGNASFDTLDIAATASGGGGSFVTAGGAQGGTARLAIAGGALAVTESFSLDAFATGVAGAGPTPTVTGGTASFSASDGATITFDPRTLTIDASASLFDNFSEGFASGFAASFAALGAGEGSATGGAASFTLDGTAMDLASLVVDAGAYVEPAGASAQGGTATATIANGGALTVDFGVELRASGIAADGSVDGSGQGGAGAGGSATLRLDGGTLAAGSVYLDARGAGGDSTLLAPGGDGAGGTIVIDIAARSGQPASLDSQSLRAQADGTGGSSFIDDNNTTSGRDGGAGTGGTITMTVGGALTLAGGEGGSELNLSATGQGGDAFAGGTGGAGAGGSVTLATVTTPGGAGSIDAGRITLAADGTGGAWTDPGLVVELPNLDPTPSSGGSGTGGAITLTLNGGAITTLAAPNGITASAKGTGRDGASAAPEFSGYAGGNGGAGAGGSFTLNLGGGALAAPLSVAVNAIAGNGGNGNAGAGGNGGDAGGGGFAIALTGAATSFDLPGAFALDLSAIAGNGGDAGDTSGAPGANGGNGGSATGGNLSLAATGSGGSLSLGSVDFNGSATGGNGGRAGAGTTAGTAGGGGDGTGGSLDLAAGPGALTIGDTNVVLDGRGGDGGAGGGGNGGTGAGGAFNAQATGGTIQLGALTVTSSGTGGSASGIGGGSVGGRIRLATANGTGGGAGAIRLASLDATTQGAGGPGIELLADGGAITVAGAAAINSGSAVRLSGVNGGTIAVGGDLVATAATGAAAGNLSANDILLTATDDILIEGDVTGARGITVQSSGGAISGGGALITTGVETGYGVGLGDISLTAANGIAVDAIDAFGSVSAIDSAGGITVDTLRAGGDVQLFSSGGAVVVATDLAAGGAVNAYGTDVSLRSLGGLAIDSLTATTGDIFVGTGAAVDIRTANAAGSFTLDVGGDARLADISAGDRIDVTARGLATLIEYIDAPTINVASYDIAIVGGEGPALIGIDTDSITLTNIGTRRSYVGGGDVAAGWSLSNDEFGRLSAHDIAIFAAGGGSGGDMTVGRLDIIGAAGSDSGARRRNLTGSDLVLAAGGEMLVNGAVALTSAGSNDRLTLSADNRLLVDTATGAIRAAGGALVMDAPTIFVGTSQAWSDISALSGIDAKTRRLGLSDGLSNPDGFLRANAILFRASRGLYIQNSGTDTRPTAERAGFTAGSGGVTIVTPPSQGAPLEIVINGRQLRADGTAATGVDLIPLLTLRGEGNASMASFNPRSTANGCFIVGASCTADVPIDTGIPQQDIINALEPIPDFSGETGLVPPLTPPIIQFAERIGLSSDPLIDEPVTGAPNENLWQGDDGAGGPAIGEQVTGTRNDDKDEATPEGQSIDQQVTGTRNDSLDEQVTGTRNDDKDEAETPKR